MMVLTKVLGIGSIILLVCTLICGAWVSTHEVEDIHFHAVLSAVAVVVALITIILYMFMNRCK